jgi:hypothetical protein
VDAFNTDGELVLLRVEGENLISKNGGERRGVLRDCSFFTALEFVGVGCDELPSSEPHPASEAARRAVVSHVKKRPVNLIGNFLIILLKSCR